ncbi:site-2 protease family protein [Rubrobacter calidifluminis]|uniref:site-2 protease family protein n=1 Tax=Rubrobacter calidifluminis TaxID=1392640 RepID=UPI002362E82B|nr:site-2 protease family protein [Rubrobacter calidifluminis]
MGGSFKIGRAFGIDVKVHWTFFLLLLVFGYSAYSSSESLTTTLITIGLIIALFVFVLLHEFGHSLVAQRLGIEIPDITLLPLGGLARMKSMPEKPLDEVKIAIAGPLVNVVLAAIFFLASFGFGGEGTGTPGIMPNRGTAGQILEYLALTNLALALFNMIPAFPMDGGRVLRGLLATRLGNVRATEISASIGQFFAFLFFLSGIFTGRFLLALIAIFIFFGAGGEAQMVRQRETMRGLSVADVMGSRRRTETVSPYHTFGQVLDAVIHGYQEDFPVVDEDGTLVGMITRNEILAAAHSPDRYSTVRDLMRTDFPTVTPEADLFQEGQRLLQESGMRAIPVVSASGELVGMLTIEDIGQANLLRGMDHRKGF